MPKDFVPIEKLSKKARKKLNARRRNDWGETSPVTKVVPSKKEYNRAREKRATKEELP